MLTIYERGKPGYEDTLASLSRRGDEDLARVEPDVRAILDAVRERGDDAVLDYTERFDGRRPKNLVLSRETWLAEARQVDPAVRDALRAAGDRIRRYHEHQRESGFLYEEDGVRLGQRVQPVAAAAVYAPGGKARYPSTVLMTAIPATVAGVERIVLITPNPTREILAIGAVAYGTQSIARVDKVVGPGNIYVACAKRLVFGAVDIDSIAGPSEILVVADDGADPEVVAADLLSQAEHDEAAYPMLVTLSRSQADAVDAAVARQLGSLPRKAIASEAVRNNGYCFVVGDLAEAGRAATILAAEHLSLSVGDPDALLPAIGAAGAIFLGYNTPEAAGDYAAGPSHVLPTGGAVRFASPLGVYDFVVRSSLICYSRAAISKQGDLLEGLARLEGLEAHARAVAIRRAK
jgi:histidinol dehydrogenase